MRFEIPLLKSPGWNALRGAIWLAFALFIALPVAGYFFALAVDPVSAFARAFPSMEETARLAALLARTAAIAAMAAAMATAAGLVVFVAGRSARPAIRRAIWAAAALPFFIPGHFSAIGWIQTIGFAGWLNQVSENSGLGTAWLPAVLYSSFGCAALMAAHAFPVALAFLCVGERTVGATAIDSAAVVAPPARLWRSFLFGWLRPWLAAAALAVFIASLLDYSIPSLLRVHAYSVEVMTAYNVYYDRERAMALAAPMAALGLAAAGALGLMLAKATWPAFSRGPIALPAPPRAYRLCSGMIAAALVLAATVVPLSTFFRMAGGWEVYRTTLVTARPQIATSLAACSLAAAISAALAIGLAAMQAPSGSSPSPGYCRVSRALSAFMLALYALPGSVLAMAMIAFWNRPRGGSVAGAMAAFYDGGMMLPIGLAAAALPVAYLIILARASATPAALIDAERMASGAPLRRWIALSAPRLARPACLAAGLAFVFAMQDLQASVLLAAPGQSTLSIRAATLLHYNPDSMVAAFCLIAFGVMAAAAALFAALAAAARAALQRIFPHYAID